MRASVKSVVEELEEIEEREAREKLLRDMKRAEEARKLEAEMTREAENDAVEKIANGLIEEVVTELSGQVADEEMMGVEAALLDKFMDALSGEMGKDILTLVCDEMAAETAHQCHREWVSNVLDSLVDVQSRRQRRIARTAFDKWRAVHLGKMRKRAALETLPLIPSGDA